MERKRWDEIMRLPTWKQIKAALLGERYPRVAMQTPKRQTRYTYNMGPMYYIGQQIVKGMEDAGYPSKIAECLRSPARQRKLRADGRSKAGEWDSGHQYSEAVDIIHASKGWNVPDEYWDTLRSVTRIVAKKYGIELECGYDWGWDKAHIEIKDFRIQRKRYKAMLSRASRLGRDVTLSEWHLWERFKEVLPEVARDYEARLRRKLKLSEYHLKLEESLEFFNGRIDGSIKL